MEVVLVVLIQLMLLADILVQVLWEPHILAVLIELLKLIQLVRDSCLAGRGGEANGSGVWLSAGGGAGNPGGYGSTYTVRDEKLNGENGTGGLMVIFAHSLNVGGLLSSNRN